MKKQLVYLFCFCLLTGLLTNPDSVLAQQTTSRYRIWVYTTSGNGSTNGTLLTSNNQLQPNSLYNVFIQDLNGNTAPTTVSIWLRSGDGFQLGASTGTGIPFPTGKDVSPGPGCTSCGTNACPPASPNCSRIVRFLIQTFSGEDYLAPLSIRIESRISPGNLFKYSPTSQIVLIPYQN